MIADDYSVNYRPEASIPEGTTVSCIIDCFKNTVPHFKTVIKQPDLKQPLNENNLTQLFVEQLKVQLRKKEVAFDVGTQYSDVFLGTKGVPDFYFHIIEEGSTSRPLFVVEAKRLPAPKKINKTEYVKGLKANGGIERFKIGKHGAGQLESGLLGFIESELPAYWISEINSWIVDLSKVDTNWKADEIVSLKETNISYSYLTSVVHKVKEADILLHHFWI